MFDIIIKNGEILSHNKESFLADIGIIGDRIVRIGCLKQQAKLIIDAKGLYVSPGFIDMHSHDDFSIMNSKPFLAKVTQGVTTNVVGQCGFSRAPFNKKNHIFIKKRSSIFGGISDDEEFCWESYMRLLEDSPLTTNVVLFAGHGNIRSMVMEVRERAASEQELKKMKKILCNIMEQGAWGMSTGLIYPPCMFTPEQDITALARIVAKFGGIYASHIRGEGVGLLPAIEEALRVGRKTDVSVEISHFKVTGMDNWRKTDDALELVYRARKEGMNITYDQYPYTASSTTATVLLPQRMHEGGMVSLLERLQDKRERQEAKKDIQNGPVPGWENYLYSCGADNVLIFQVDTEKNRRFEGKSFKQAAQELGKDTVDFLFDLLLEEKAAVNIVAFSMCEDSVKKIMKSNYGFIGSDGIPGRRPHPRLWGTFPRVLKKYVREEKIISMNEAIYKMSKGPAEKLGLKNRGEIKQGNIADIVIFNPDKVEDCATYQHPSRKAAGIEYVIVNGKRIINKGEFTGETSGKVLRKV